MHVVCDCLWYNMVWLVTVSAYGTRCLILNITVLLLGEQLFLANRFIILQTMYIIYDILPHK